MPRVRAGSSPQTRLTCRRYNPLRIRILLSAALLFAVALAGVAVTSTRSGAAQANGPNLIVRSDILGEQWLVRDENLSPVACSVEEGGVTPGLRRLVRFTVMTPNIGNQDIYVG